MGFYIPHSVCLKVWEVPAESLAPAVSLNVHQLAVPQVPGPFVVQRVSASSSGAPGHPELNLQLALHLYLELSVLNVFFSMASLSSPCSPPKCGFVFPLL